jgi:hypothetical protein
MQWKKKLELLLSSLSNRQFESFTRRNESLLLHAQITKYKMIQIRLASKERRVAVDKARKYMVGKGPIKVRDGLRNIAEKKARQVKGKGKSNGKGKGKNRAKEATSSSLILDIDGDSDGGDDDIDGEDIGFFMENPELVGFQFGDSVPDPFLDNNDFVGLD